MKSLESNGLMFVVDDAKISRVKCSIIIDNVCVSIGDNFPK